MGAGSLSHWTPGKSHLCFLRLQRVCMLSCSAVFDFLQTPWAVAHQALLSMRFSRREYWIGLLFSPPGNLPDPGIEPLAGRFFITKPPGKPKAMARLFKKSPLVLERLPGFFVIISIFTTFHVYNIAEPGLGAEATELRSTFLTSGY